MGVGKNIWKKTTPPVPYINEGPLKAFTTWSCLLASRQGIYHRYKVILPLSCHQTCKPASLWLVPNPEAQSHSQLWVQSRRLWRVSHELWSSWHGVLLLCKSHASKATPKLTTIVSKREMKMSVVTAIKRRYSTVKIGPSSFPGPFPCSFSVLRGCQLSPRWGAG